MLIQRGYQNIGLLCANQGSGFSAAHLHGGTSDASPPYVTPNQINAALPPNFSTTGASQLPEFYWRGRAGRAELCVSDELACGARLYGANDAADRSSGRLAVVGFGDSDVGGLPAAVNHHGRTAP